ncbi:hypothetical protein J5N97_014509 [Dioscorea zingiberensis]|uniref:RNase H type-1 domain-containing protein n=1 Tax=Dioscorea zingiberensis TaxID=325984 RepID=A0A9D5HJK1_9LILI|nr:hypothetical protein J5N97_014509 [Dioscorea zingiberensis]
MASVAVVPYQQYWISADDKDVEWHEEWEVGEDFLGVNHSLVAVNLINGIFAATLEDRDILRKIDSIASSFEGWTVSHVWREANRVADKLAKMGGSGNEVIFMEDDMPVGISSIVDEDMMGKI